MPGHRPLHPDASWTELIATDADWDAADPELLSAMFHQLVPDPAVRRRISDTALRFYFY